MHIQQWYKMFKLLFLGRTLPLVGHFLLYELELIGALEEWRVE